MAMLPCLISASPEQTAKNCKEKKKKKEIDLPILIQLS
jgi:hypothetical protein